MRLHVRASTDLTVQITLGLQLVKRTDLPEDFLNASHPPNMFATTSDFQPFPRSAPAIARITSANPCFLPKLPK